MEQWTQFSRPSGVYIEGNDVIYVSDSMPDDAGDSLRPEWKEGIRIGSAANGRVTAFIDDEGPDGSQEGVVADANGVIYASRTSGMGLRRYI